MLLDFGKYKGIHVKDVPLPYVIFLAGYRMNGTNREASELQGCSWVRLHKKDVHEFAKNFLTTKCWHCGRKLVPVGHARINGATHEDWDGRYLHKKCWSELKVESDFS